MCIYIVGVFVFCERGAAGNGCAESARVHVATHETAAPHAA